jgi:hypothetical protein
VTFSVLALGPSLSYQWWFNGSPITGANSAAYTISNVQNSNAGNYQVVVSNGTGSVASAVVGLSIGYPLQMAVAPVTNLVSLLYGQTLNLSAWPTNDDHCSPASSSWSRNGGAVGFVTGTNLSVQAVNNQDAGLYQVVLQIWPGRRQISGR